MSFAMGPGAAFGTTALGLRVRGFEADWGAASEAPSPSGKAAAGSNIVGIPGSTIGLASLQYVSGGIGNTMRSSFNAPPLVFDGIQYGVVVSPFHSGADLVGVTNG
jgi:hypothetical protein